MFDSHVHTSFSCDSQMLLEDAIKKSREMGIGIIVTDHMDINPFRGPEFTFDVPAFFREYDQYRADDVLLGIEMGLRMEAVEANKAYIKNHDFDFILCSTHAPYDMETNLEYYDKALYEGLTKQEAYNEYFDSMLKGVQENDYFDALAHIDYIARYSPYEDSEIHYDAFKDKIDAVLSHVAQLDKSLEISTRRLQDSGTRQALQKIYNRFYELGGKTVTLGSDSHGTATIGSLFSTALDMAKTANLTPVYYKKRKRIKIE